MTFDEWLAEGIAAGYCSEPVCLMHDSGNRAMFQNEEDFLEFWERYEEGYDPCLGGVTLHADR